MPEGDGIVSDLLFLWAVRDSNPQPAEYESDELTNCSNGPVILFSWKGGIPTRNVTPSMGAALSVCVPSRTQVQTRTENSAFGERSVTITTPGRIFYIEHLRLIENRSPRYKGGHHP